VVGAGYNKILHFVIGDIKHRVTCTMAVKLVVVVVVADVVFVKPHRNTGARCGLLLQM